MTVYNDENLVKCTRTCVYEIDARDLDIFREDYNSDKEFIDALTEAVQSENDCVENIFDDIYPENSSVRVDSIISRRVPEEVEDEDVDEDTNGGYVYTANDIPTTISINCGKSKQALVYDKVTKKFVRV